jgi:hypothetical protein
MIEIRREMIEKFSWRICNDAFVQKPLQSRKTAAVFYCYENLHCQFSKIMASISLVVSLVTKAIVSVEKAKPCIVSTVETFSWRMP